MKGKTSKTKSKATKADSGLAHQVEVVDISSLKTHPRNYRSHPDDQLGHLVSSIKDHGFYRNIVVARDGTILAGHGVVKAAEKLGKKQVPVVRLDLAPDDPRAWKILTGDNEIAKLAEVDDRALTELLKEMAALGDELLLGTGFDKQQLAALAFITRPRSEINDFDAAAEWAGMPEYDSGSTPIQLVISFDTAVDRDKLIKQLKLVKSLTKPGGMDKAWSAKWPDRVHSDFSSVKFHGAGV